MGSTLAKVVGVYAMSVAGAALSVLIETAYNRFRREPQRPPPPPPEDMNISQVLMISEAVNKLGMDVVKHYNYAICGPRGTGKSTFINCIRLLDDPDPSNPVREQSEQSAARVGITETTNQTRRYRFPPVFLEFEHIVIWDIPGSSTVNHPINDYFLNQVLYAYDCILITSSSNFGEEQIKLMREANTYNTPVVIVITKLDQHVDDKVKILFQHQRRYHPTLEEYHPIVQQTIEELKSYAVTQQSFVPRDRIFVVSLHKYRDYFKSVDAYNWKDADEDGLLSGEMGKLVKYLADRAVARQN